MTVTSMPQPTLTAQHVPPLAEDVILGVDTHKDIHAAAVITTLGAPLAHQEFPATTVGYRQLIFWARSFGVVRRAGVERTGSYGAALTRALSRENIEVVEVNQPDRATRRKRGKTDAIDADAAARAVLSGRATTTPKTADGPAADMRVLRLAKESAVRARTQAMNQLKAVLLVLDPDLREQLSGLSSPALITTCAALDGDHSEAAFTLHLLACRIQSLAQEIKELTKRTTKALMASRPQLLELVGAGPDSAAVLLIAAGDNPDRLTDEASFAALCGVSPVEQSSGMTQRRRLNRGGHRQANAALYRIVQSRMRWDERTQAYLQRRTAEGLSRREIIRCLKRYVARELYRHIRRPAITAPPAA
ncbi:IS110 family transposase [Streptomyces sp. ADI93-02]|uniref:IS110 family transposase n=1 Tax=Streptomyces sp. ADI93-02 TaxID=1522757 RepID=UPI000F54E91E|nr:IS110 family transposase [Streptomyces sp. ADI93-02]RPK32543.1 Transposase IS116/IS110/IS902 family protein [Streptomyces sp. ADI93-02]